MLDIGKKEQHPDVVLKQLYKNLNAAAEKGDAGADNIKRCTQC